MKNIVVLGAVFILLVVGKSNAQNQKIKELKIGDVMPDIEITNVINYPTSSIKISDLKKKLVVIDFWATWCQPCISSFPKLDSLQNKFGNKIQILPVTSEETGLVSGFIAKMNKIINVSLPSVTNDKLLNRFFKHTTLPHYVWIDSARKVIAITDGKDINETNIALYLDKAQLKYAIKNDDDRRATSSFIPSIRYKKGDSTELEEMDFSKVVFFSILTKYTPGLRSGANFRDSTSVIISNRSIVGIYKPAFFGNNIAGLNSSPSNLIVEIKDSLLYKYVTGAGVSPGLEALAWLKENAYCYRLVVPTFLSKKRFDIMLEELNRYFGKLYNIEGVMEDRNVNYLALVRNSNSKELASSGGEKFIKSDKFSLRMQNLTLASLISELTLPLQLYPRVFDETGYNGKVDLELNCQLSNLKDLNKQLEKYGLQLIEKQKVMKTAIIREKQNLTKSN